MANKVTQTKDELNEHLKEQLDFLETAGESFDNGDHKQAKLMAVNLRVLLHDTPKSNSLLNQLGIKDTTLFYDSASKPSNVIETYSGLVYKGVGPEGGMYVPPLDELPPDQQFKRVSFDQYWVTPIFKDNKGNVFTRADLVLAIANKDGGAHIDAELDESYVDLTRNNSLGWMYGNDAESGPLKDASLSAVRQIGHEVLKSLVPNYPEKKKLNTQNSFLFGDIFVKDGFSAGVMVSGGPRAPQPKVGRNEPCICGSGKKWKKCGYIETEEHQKLSKVR